MAPVCTNANGNPESSSISLAVALLVLGTGVCYTACNSIQQQVITAGVLRSFQLQWLMRKEEGLRTSCSLGRVLSCVGSHLVVVIHSVAGLVALRAGPVFADMRVWFTVRPILAPRSTRATCIRRTSAVYRICTTCSTSKRVTLVQPCCQSRTTLGGFRPCHFTNTLVQPFVERALLARHRQALLASACFPWSHRTKAYLRVDKQSQQAKAVSTDDVRICNVPKKNIHSSLSHTLQ